DGNMAYDVASSGSIDLDVSDSSNLIIENNFIVDTPNINFNLIGSGGEKAVLLGNYEEPDSGEFYINALKDDTNLDKEGYYQYNVRVMKEVSSDENELADVFVDSNTKIMMGAGSVAGIIKSVESAGNIAIYNQGEIHSADFSNADNLGNNKEQIYVLNKNKFHNKKVNEVIKFGYVGQLYPGKGIEYILDIFLELTEKTDIFFYLYGKFTNEEYEKIITEKYKSNKIIEPEIKNSNLEGNQVNFIAYKKTISDPVCLYNDNSSTACVAVTF
ncbi:MAG: hypothetical protein ACOC2F_06420, partial [Bacteroidota bacterium]